MFAPSLFENKIILVSGGRSGIGFSIAKTYLQYGAQVFIASRNKELLEKAAEKLKQYGQCHAVTCDIRSPEDIEALSQKIKEITGHLDILVNNTGGQFPAPAHVMAEKGWTAVINNNLNGTFYMCQKMANRFYSTKQWKHYQYHC